MLSHWSYWRACALVLLIIPLSYSIASAGNLFCVVVLWSGQCRKGFDVRSPFARRSLRRRIIALTAAYAIALGGLFASFAAAGIAANAAIGAGTITCHSDGAGAPSPAQNDKTGGACIDSCCVGCVMVMAALPPPPIKAIGAPQSVARLLAPQSAVAGPVATSTASHQSRAPPLRA